ncbi:hypothetical protein M0802_006244 [Mischocyttarus mexicanus]|nr:hypothetical protein M0802_006244 [Mischocyttarus mexicanus]
MRKRMRKRRWTSKGWAGCGDDIVVSAKPTAGRPIHVTLGGNPNQFWLGEQRGAPFTRLSWQIVLCRWLVP